jgi:hypothetical protein
MRKSRRSVVVLAIFALVLCSLSPAILGIYGNTPPQFYKDRVQQAQIAWEAQGIDDYRMTIFVNTYDYIQPFDLVIQGGVVVEHSVNTDSEADYTERLGSIFLSNVNDYTMSNLFMFVSDKLEAEVPPPGLALCPDTSTWHYEVDIDPQLSYIQQIRYTNCAPGGLICPASPSHCSINMRVMEFEPITEATP